MTDKEISKLRKKALVEMVLAQTKEKEDLLKEIASLKEQLADKEIRINNAGTIAEAAFEMNGVLEAAQAAAKQYLDNVKALSERQETECLIKEKAVAARCMAQEQATFERCSFMKEETEKNCMQMESETKARLRELEQMTRTRLEELERETNQRCEVKEKETEEKCIAMTNKAHEDVEAKWEDLSYRLEEFYRAHIGLRNLLTADASVQRN